MVDESQNATLQPGANTSTGGSLQPIAQTGLQPQTESSLQTPSSSTLQTTSAQTQSSINQLDQGGAPIPLSGISNTTTNTVQATVTSQPHTKQILLYGGAAIIVAAVMAGMVYSLLRQR